MKIEIKKPIEAVNNIVGHLGLTEEQKQRLLMRFSEPTKYGLINAITNLAARVVGVIFASREIQTFKLISVSSNSQQFPLINFN